MNDVLTVSIDSNGADETVMVVAKTIGSTTYVVGEFRNDEAIEMYNKLNQGNPFLKSGLSGE